MLYRLLRYSSLILSVIVLISCSSKPANPYQDDVEVESYDTGPAQDAQGVYKLPLMPDSEVKNVILFIGDGTSLTQLQVAQQHFKGEEGLLAVQQMPVTGLVKTYSANNLITDSAAGATAYATGKKTRNKMIGQGPDSTSYVTLMERANQQGLKTGIVATSSVTHATPASFLTHIDNRYREPEIAEQIINSDADVVLGGGLGFFVPASDSLSERDDEKDLLSIARKKDFQIVRNQEQLKAADQDKRLLGLFNQDGLMDEDREPTLAEMTTHAVKHLNNENGFFLMVEGSQIDWAGHDNDLDYLLSEVREYDLAVAKALEFAMRDEQTLVLATADHETGGLTLINSDSGRENMEIVWTTSHHTGVQVPIFAFGPQAMQFTGVWDNVQISKKIAAILKLESFPAQL